VAVAVAVVAAVAAAVQLPEHFQVREQLVLL
jgi:hypothetical protein